jgi:uncharacterized membrane-anchored protein
MKHKLILALILPVLAIFGFEIYKKEQLLANGETFYLELAPRDPRSLMQGDYMVLNYAVLRQIPSNSADKGIIALRKDEKNIASFVRVVRDDGRAKGEFFVNYAKEGWRKAIRPDSYFFQEGTAQIYEAAKYGIFKIDKNDNKLLVGLADKDLKEIKP